MDLLKALNIDVDPQKHRDRMIIQKVGYIVQEMLGTDLSYSFKWYTYGPYSRKLSKELGSIELCKSIEGKGGYVNIDSILYKGLKQILSICSEINKPMHRCLEMITSLHMIANKTYPKSEDPINDLINIKPYMDKQDLEKIYSRLKAMKYL